MDEQREDNEPSSDPPQDDDESPPVASDDSESPPADEPGAAGSSGEEPQTGSDDAEADNADADGSDTENAETDDETLTMPNPGVEPDEREPTETEDGQADDETAAPGIDGVDDEAMADYAEGMGPSSPEEVAAAAEDLDDAEEFDDENPQRAGDEVLPDIDPDTEAPPAVEGGGPAEPIFEEQEGPDLDQEMPLAVHIEEMVRRLLVVIAIAGVVTLIAYPLSEDLISYLWQTHIPSPMENRPRVYGPLEFILTKLKVASLSGTIAGLPVLVYQSYRFMRPGLYPHERRYYLAAVPTSLVLAIIGVTFAHFVVLPNIFIYFTTYTKDAAIVAYGLQETFNLILVLMGYMAIVFQIPLFVMLATMMDLVSRQWLEAKRLLFWGSFAGLAFLVSPDPTGMAPIIIAITMVVLFEGTLAALRWTGN